MAVKKHILRNFGHPLDRRPGWDMLLLVAEKESELLSIVASAEHKHWRIWSRRGHEGLTAQLYKPAGARTLWHDSLHAPGGRYLVYGPSWVQDYTLVSDAIADSGVQPRVIVVARAHGTQRLAARYAAQHGLPLVDWSIVDPQSSAKPVDERNLDILSFVDGVIAISDHSHAPTRAVISAAKDAGVEVLVQSICSPSLETNTNLALRQPEEAQQHWGYQTCMQ